MLYNVDSGRTAVYCNEHADKSMENLIKSFSDGYCKKKADLYCRCPYHGVILQATCKERHGQCPLTRILHRVAVL